MSDVAVFPRPGLWDWAPHLRESPMRRPESSRIAASAPQLTHVAALLVQMKMACCGGITTTSKTKVAYAKVEHIYHDDNGKSCCGDQHKVNIGGVTDRPFRWYGPFGSDGSRRPLSRPCQPWSRRCLRRSARPRHAATSAVSKRLARPNLAAASGLRVQRRSACATASEGREEVRGAERDMRQDPVRIRAVSSGG